MNAVEKIIDRHDTEKIITSSGLLHPDGTFTPVNIHQVTCELAKTTLLAYYKAGGLRIAMHKDQLAIEGKEIIDNQLNALKKLLRKRDFGYLGVCLDGDFKQTNEFLGVKPRHLIKLVGK